MLAAKRSGPGGGADAVGIVLTGIAEISLVASALGGGGGVSFLFSPFFRFSICC